jgi:hypothetical protein
MFVNERHSAFRDIRLVEGSVLLWDMLLDLPFAPGTHRSGQAGENAKMALEGPPQARPCWSRTPPLAAFKSSTPAVRKDCQAFEVAPASPVEDHPQGPAAFVSAKRIG